MASLFIHQKIISQPNPQKICFRIEIEIDTKKIKPGKKLQLNKYSIKLFNPKNNHTSFKSVAINDDISTLTKRQALIAFPAAKRTYSGLQCMSVANHRPVIPCHTIICLLSPLLLLLCLISCLPSNPCSDALSPSYPRSIS